VQHSIALGASVDVKSSTPTLFINGSKNQQCEWRFPYDLLKSLWSSLLNREIKADFFEAYQLRQINFRVRSCPLLITLGVDHNQQLISIYFFAVRDHDVVHGSTAPSPGIPFRLRCSVRRD